jgi:hypothetical protein
VKFELWAGHPACFYKKKRIEWRIGSRAGVRHGIRFCCHEMFLYGEKMKKQGKSGGSPPFFFAVLDIFEII